MIDNSTNELNCRELLLNLEENTNNPNTIKSLHKKIDDLQTKIIEQQQQYQKRELELHKDYDLKKSKLIMRYLEMKIQVDNYKNFYDEGKKIWQKDLKNLYHLIQDLLKKIKEKDEQYLIILQDIDREFNLLLNYIPNHDNIYKNESTQKKKYGSSNNTLGLASPRLREKSGSSTGKYIFLLLELKNLLITLR